MTLKVANFWNKVAIKTEPECWLWTGSIGTHGYGKIKINGKTHTASRVLWSLLYGNIPADQCVMHICDVPSCVNPGHLKLGTHAENMMDMSIKGRASHGTKSAHAKLNEMQVRIIKRLIDGQCTPLKEIGEIFSVSSSTIGYIKTGRNWRRVTAQMDCRHV